MRKTTITVMLAAATLLSLCSCRKKPADVSSDAVSSQIAKPEPVSSYPYDQSGWGLPDAEENIFRPGFLSSDENGNIFYCAVSGGIYKRLKEGNGLSKIYANSAYDFFSVNYVDPSLICVGCKSKKNVINYIMFNLKEKTVSNAVTDDRFSDKDIYSLIHYKEKVFFLSNPDRYGRYGLYLQLNGKVTLLQAGVNEFFIYKDRVFYNLGSYIFSMNPDGSDRQLIHEAKTNDMLGFTVFGSSLICTNGTSTYLAKMFSDDMITLPAKLNVWTCTSNKDYAFFCGADGGIYSFSSKTEMIDLVSPYTAGQISLVGDYLYMTPADPEDYLQVKPELLIKDGIYRFKLSELIPELKEKDESSDTATSSESVSSSVSSDLSDISDSSTDSSQSSSAQMPERFGR